MLSYEVKHRQEVQIKIRKKRDVLIHLIDGPPLKRVCGSANSTLLTGGQFCDPTWTYRPMVDVNRQGQGRVASVVEAVPYSIRAAI